LQHVQRSSRCIKRIIERALWEQGLRRPLAKGVRRHEWKAAHGFRKFYKSRAEQVMKPINVEITMNHDIGVSASYYKPTEHDILEDYLKAADLLTINGDTIVLQRKVTDLQEKAKDTDYIIKAKLLERDEELKGLKEMMLLMQKEQKDLRDSLRMRNKV
jgi:hypothetical protein